MRYRAGYGTLVSGVGKNNFSSNNTNNKIGKVFGVITTENTPTKKQFERAGGFNGIGSIFYLNYVGSENVSGSNLDSFLDTCTIAKPFHSSNQNYPLIGELVLLTDLPSAASQLSPNANQPYYLGTINIFNDPQQNAPSGDSLGRTFNENSDIRPLLTFEGDRIYQGRRSNGIRFGSTVKSRSNINEWSSIGNDGDPITILVNGYVTTDTGSLTPNIEEINKEKSSIYMTSTQLLPLQPGALIINPIFTPIPLNKYANNSQIILNSDRIVLNTKRDDIILNSSGFIELSTDSIINLNSSGHIHLNIEPKNPNSRILLGTKADNTVPDEPVLLGGQTHDLLLEICNTLQRLAGYLSSAAAVSSDGSLPIPSVNDGGTQLFNDVNNLINKLGTIQSDKVFTI
jgi:hypothetical protein